MKVVINVCFGGFGLSRKGLELFVKKQGKKLYSYSQGEGFSVEAPYSRSEDDNLFSMDFTEDKGESFVWNKKFDSSGHISSRDIKRDDPLLVETVEELGDIAEGRCASFSVVEIPDGIEWEITEYDGSESVEESHRSWR